MTQHRFTGKMMNSSERLFNADLLSVKDGNIALDCTSGALWVTWKNSEITMTPGQSYEIFSKGKVCIYALSDASVRIRKLRQGPTMKGFSVFRPGTWRRLSPAFS